MERIVLLLVYSFVNIILTCEGTITVCIPLNSSSEPFPEAHLTETTVKLLQDELLAKLNATEDDTIYIGHVDVDLKHPAIRLKGSVDDVEVSNFTTYVVCFVDFDMTSSDLTLANLTFPQLSIQGTYDITGNIGELFDIYGVGDFWMRMTNFSVAITHFNMSIGDELCVPLNLDVSLGKMDNKFAGLMDDPELEELFNKAISAITPEIIQILWQELKDAVDGPLEKIINDFLHKRANKGFMGNLRSGMPYCKTSEEINKL